MSIVSIKDKSSTPKYKQIIASIEEAIISGAFKKGDKLPSLNRIKNQHALSRDTVLYAFNELKTRGIIQSIVGKGYYVMSEDIDVSQKIFLLFDELNSFKEDLYNSFVFSLGDTVQVDIFFHHFNMHKINTLLTLLRLKSLIVNNKAIISFLYVYYRWNLRIICYLMPLFFISCETISLNNEKAFARVGSIYLYREDIEKNILNFKNN